MATVFMLSPTCGGGLAGKATLELTIWRQDGTAGTKTFFRKIPVFSRFAFWPDIYFRKGLVGHTRFFQCMGRASRDRLAFSTPRHRFCWGGAETPKPGVQQRIKKPTST
jgi:hypothetical protein